MGGVEAVIGGGAGEGGRGPGAAAVVGMSPRVGRRVMVAMVVVRRVRVVVVDALVRPEGQPLGIGGVGTPLVVEWPRLSAVFGRMPVIHPAG